MIHLNITIKGRVQGVFFRNWAKEQAVFIGITGFVRNEPDGSVYIEAEGKEDMLEKFLSKLKQGSPFSSVSGVEAVHGEVKSLKGFEVQE